MRLYDKHKPASCPSAEGGLGLLLLVVVVLVLVLLLLQVIIIIIGPFSIALLSPCHHNGLLAPSLDVVEVGVATFGMGKAPWVSLQKQAQEH